MLSESAFLGNFLVQLFFLLRKLFRNVYLETDNEVSLLCMGSRNIRNALSAEYELASYFRSGLDFHRTRSKDRNLDFFFCTEDEFHGIQMERVNQMRIISRQVSFGFRYAEMNV